ncbi:hypothetical protein ACOMHN_044506 [Nucella lapillus]
MCCCHQSRHGGGHTNGDNILFDVRRFGHGCQPFKEHWLSRGVPALHAWVDHVSTARAIKGCARYAHLPPRSPTAAPGGVHTSSEAYPARGVFFTLDGLVYILLISKEHQYGLYWSKRRQQQQEHRRGQQQEQEAWATVGARGVGNSRSKRCQQQQEQEAWATAGARGVGNSRSKRRGQQQEQEAWATAGARGVGNSRSKRRGQQQEQEEWATAGARGVGNSRSKRRGQQQEQEAWATAGARGVGNSRSKRRQQHKEQQPIVIQPERPRRLAR